MKPEKVAVVTGAARGIGQAICEQLLEDGFHVIGLDISPVEWSQSAQLSSYQVNLCDAEAVSEVVESVVEQHGRIDALVNNAGITRDALLPDMLEQDWDSVIDVNLKAVFLLTQRVAPVMLEQGTGSIVSISSIVGTDGNIGQSNYGASKGGVISMSKGWAKELSRKGCTDTRQLCRARLYRHRYDQEPARESYSNDGRQNPIRAHGLSSRYCQWRLFPNLR